MQRWHPSKMKYTFNVRKNHYQLVSQIMNGIWQSTYAKVYFKMLIMFIKKKIINIKKRIPTRI